MPTLLDRLRDDAPHRLVEAPEEYAVTRKQMRDIVQRDLAYLLNTTSMEDRIERVLPAFQLFGAAGENRRVTLGRGRVDRGADRIRLGPRTRLGVGAERGDAALGRRRARSPGGLRSCTPDMTARPGIPRAGRRHVRRVGT